MHARRTGALVLALAWHLAGCDTPKPGSQPEPRPTAPAVEPSARVARAVLGQANQARRQLGLAALKPDRVLDDVAREFSRELARRGEVTHLSTAPYRRTLADRLRAGGAVFGASAENLARSVEAEELLPAQVVVLWMRTPGARQPLATPEFAFAGTGAARAEDGAWYVVQIYAAPRGVDGVIGLPQP
ncbi:MAG TPA: CAP domain-containing protein [Longimicrobium sp.]